MARLIDKDGAGYGSATHLLWLATMGLKETYFSIQQRISDEPVIYNNGMRFLAIHLLLNEMKKDNNKEHVS